MVASLTWVCRQAKQLMLCEVTMQPPALLRNHRMVQPFLANHWQATVTDGVLLSVSFHDLLYRLHRQYYMEVKGQRITGRPRSINHLGSPALVIICLAIFEHSTISPDSRHSDYDAQPVFNPPSLSMYCVCRYHSQEECTQAFPNSTVL